LDPWQTTSPSTGKSKSSARSFICIGEVGWSVVTHAQGSLYPQLPGNHGYDPAEPTMAAIFLAHGPAFRSGVVLPAFDNVDVYPLLARLMGLRPLANDGRLAPLEAALGRRCLRSALALLVPEDAERAGVGLIGIVDAPLADLPCADDEKFDRRIAAIDQVVSAARAFWR
jgi:hypothetical protein